MIDEQTLPAGAQAALLLACPKTGVIQPPPSAGQSMYRSADLNRLREAKLITDHGPRRADGLYAYRLLPLGWEARRRLRKAGGR